MADVKLTVSGEDKSAPAFNSVKQSVDKTSKAFSDMSGAAEVSANAIADNMGTARDSIDEVSQSGNGLKAFLVGLGAAFLDFGRGIYESIAPEFANAENKVKQVGTTIGEHLKSWAEQSLATAAAFKLFGPEVAMAVGIAFNAVLALTLAYKGLKFAIGLVTGESYKSTNIDALIAANNEAKALQGQLQLTAADANALNDALRRTGTDKADYVAVYENVENAIRSNGDELDRLGVKYQDVNGKMLSTREIVQNAKNVLDGYTAGWDRNQAATALGMGSYDKLNNYLKVTQQELGNSKKRLDEYNLGIGTEAQGAIIAYETVMREFTNESHLMSEGFKRAIADNIMPALTDLANFFKDGFPFVVNAFRYSMATITSLLWGLKMSTDLVVDTIKGGFGVVSDILIGVAQASARALTGDFSGAEDALVRGWENAKNRVSKTGAEMTADAQHNAAAMKLAWGFDNRTDSNGGKPVKGGKPWDPGEVEEDLAAYQSSLNAYKDAYDRYSKAFEENRAALTRQGNERNEALNQIDFDKGLIDLQSYLDKRHKLSEDAMKTEIASKKKLLQEAQTAFAEADKADKEDGGDIGTQTARMNALAKLTEAQGALNKVIGDSSLLKIKNAEESRKMTDAALASYRAAQTAALESAGEFEAAESLKQEMYRKSAEYLKLEADALAGNEDAWLAMMALEKKEAVGSVTAQNQTKDAFRAAADEVAKTAAEIRKLNGEDSGLIDSETKLRDGMKNEAELRDKLTLAWVTGTAAEIAQLSAKVQLQNILNQRLRDEIALQERKKVLTGEIVGFNGDQPIYADSYQKEQAANGYVTNNQLLNGTGKAAGTNYWGESIDNSGNVINSFGMPSFVSINSPYVGTFATGTDYVPRTGLALIHQGERIVTAADNASGNYGGAPSIQFGDVNLVLPNVTNQSTADDLANAIFPKLVAKLETYNRRRKAA